MFTPRLYSFVLLGAAWFAAAGSAFAQRQMEKLGRGVVVMRTSSTQTYIGWRLLGNDPEEIAFNLYRSANGGTPVKLNSSPITTTTNYVDTPPGLSTTAYTYTVRPVLDDVEVSDIWANPLSTPPTLSANAAIRQYIPIPMQAPPGTAGTYHNVNDCWVGDLDGDGEYDFVVSRTYEGSGSTQEQWVQAYKRDGTLLWQINMGPNSVNQNNVVPGSSALSVGHGDGLTVYDMDGDGKAEVMLRVARGVIFNYGQPSEAVVTAPDDEVNFIAVLDGLTGNEKARAQVPIPSHWVNQNHVAPGHFGILYSDGVTPSLVYSTSNRNPDSSFNKYVSTWRYENGQLVQQWLWEAGPDEHHAEGHQIRLADVNNDGKDEFVDIGHVLKADGSGQINGDKITDVQHGDRFHVTDMDPDRPGLETYLIQQTNPQGLTSVYHAADKSTVIKKTYAGKVVDVGRGVVGPFVPDMYGLQFFSTEPGVFDCKGNQVYPTRPWPSEVIWWDGAIDREIINSDAFRINKFGPNSGSPLYSIGSPDVAPGGSYRSGKPPFWGDILGDWREEVVAIANDNSEIRLFSTANPDLGRTFNGQPVRIYTLMHNIQYRIQQTTKGYAQSSHPDYYIGYGMAPLPPPPMALEKLVWKGGTGSTTWDSGTSSSWLDNGVDSAFANGDTVRFDISGDNTTEVVLNGTLQPGVLKVSSPKDYAFTGSGSLAGTMKLIKMGAGTLTLPGTHTFTGKTTIWDGALEINGGLQNSPITIWGGTWGGAAAEGKTGGRLAGTGQIGQLVTVKYRGAVTPGSGMNSPGTLSFSNGLSAESGSTFALDLSDDPTGLSKPNDRIEVTGDLSLAGKVSLIVNPLDDDLSPGTYTLMTYTGTLTGNVSNLSVVVPPGTPYTISVGGGAVSLTVSSTRTSGEVTWRGTGNVWDIATSQNWLKSGVPDLFVGGDTVTFDSSGSTASNVTLATVLPVGGVTVDSSSDYTFGGSGSIAGPGGLTKSGTGVLTVSTINDYTGPTVLNGGTLAVVALGDAGFPSSIGSSSGDAGNLILNGGTLRFTGLQTGTDRNLTIGSAGATIDTLETASVMLLSGTVSGSGVLTKNGPGTLLLVGHNTYSGGTVINNGRLYIGFDGNPDGPGTGPITINNGTLAVENTVNGVSQNGTWDLIVPEGAIARIEADGRSTLTGSLTGSGDLTFYTPYVRTDLNGNWSAFTGRINVVSDADGGDFRLGNTAGLGGAAIDLGNLVSAYYRPSMSSNLTLNIGELSGSASSSLAGGPTANRTLTWQIGSRNTDSTYAGLIKNGTATSLTAINKVGTGVLTLTGASTYTGATTVSEGELVLDNGSLSGSSVAVSEGAGFGGKGTVTGNVSFADGSTLLTNPSAGPLAIVGNLSLSGTVNVASVSGVVLSEGSYTLYTYTGTLTGTPTFAWSTPGYNATFDTSIPGQVSVTLVEKPRDPTDVVWTGALSSTWDSSTKNWSGPSGSTAFVTEDRVRFDDTSTVAGITLSGNLFPESVIVDSAQDYTFSGSGSINGDATLTKSGAGMLLISTAQNFTGNVTIHEGILSFSTSSSIGTGTVILDGGELRVGALLSNPIQINGGGTIRATANRTLSGAISGSGSLSLIASATLSINDVSGFSGIMNLGTSSGTLRANHSGFTGSANMALDLGSGSVTFLRQNSAASVAIGALSGGANTTFNNGPTATTYSIGAKNLDTLYSGSITGSASIIKIGTAALTLAGANTYTGSTHVSSGALYITGSLGATNVSVASNETIGGNGMLAGDLFLATGAKLAFGVTPSAIQGLTVSGTATLTGNIIVEPVLLGGVMSPGTYTLLAYSGALAGSPTFTWNDTTDSGYAATFDTTTSGLVKITLIAPPEAPSGLMASSENSQASLGWNAVPGAESYTVLRSLTSGSGYTIIASGVTGNFYQNTGLANGLSYYYVVRAVNPAGTSQNSNVTTATPVQTFNQWADDIFPGQTNPAIIGQAADPDSDGYPNLLEYFFGTTPSSSDPGGLSSTSLDGNGNLVLNFRMSKNLSGVTYKVQQSTDLSLWTDVTVEATEVSDEEDYRHMQVSVPMGTHTNLYLRLVVTAP
ncbi:MAG: autotransporter-associated beta strand repeat-containing protein [Luteolibacter sp.]